MGLWLEDPKHNRTQNQLPFMIHMKPETAEVCKK